MSKINRWIEEYTPEMLSRASYKTSDKEAAKDLVQETFLAVAKNVGKFQNKSTPKTWIFSILNNKIADHLRQKYKKPRQTEFDNISDYFDENGEWNKNKEPAALQEKNLDLTKDQNFLEILYRCIEYLPDRWNALIKLKFFSEKKSKDICQDLEITTTNMWQMMHRAKLKLRACIEDNWFKKEYI